MRWIGETPLVPLAYVQFKIPMRKSRKINPYTSEGRAEIHDNLRVDVNSMLWLMRHPISTESVRYNDNRVSLYAGQDGKCAITGKKLDVQTCIYMMVSLAPVPMATWGNHEQSHVGQNYLKSLFALGFQGFLILICVAIYAVLIQNIAISGDAISSIWSIVGYTVLLCFSLFKTSSVAKTLLGAH